MWLKRREHKVNVECTTSELLERIQRLERAHAELRSRIEGERQLRVLTAQIEGAAQIAPVIGSAIQKFAQAMRAPFPLGRAGGVTRARWAWPYPDGTFMPEAEVHEAAGQEYERFARGGRARASAAKSAADGTFLMQVNEP